MKKIEIIVVGAGHAGCEAAYASAKMGHETLLITLKKENIAKMSCNPSIGGLAKGNLVREIDALGGLMGKITDQTMIQFRMLNKSKGPAVWSPRAQVDLEKYSEIMRQTLINIDKLEIMEGKVHEIWIEKEKTKGVILDNGEKIRSEIVILTTGTFLNGVMYIGDEIFEGGRIGEESIKGLTKELRKNGIEAGRLKTGTTMRINKDTIKYDEVVPQGSNDYKYSFSFYSNYKRLNEINCYITKTNKEIHAIINNNLDRSPLYTGIIKSTGPRYCPSIEDKIVKFPWRNEHHIFLEPEGLNTKRVYVNGMSTSLPKDVQLTMLKKVPGLKNAEIIQYGYAIEYDYFPSIQLKKTLESKKIKNLFFAGQINGTSGYEEAAAQGLMAGINASNKLSGMEPFVLKRSEAYIGVLIDDLITMRITEPYRMFTSRAEYRLLLRQDDADRRLTKYGYKFGLLSEREQNITEQKYNKVEEIKALAKKTRILVDGKKILIYDFLKRPNVKIDEIKKVTIFNNVNTDDILKTIENDIKYSGYIERNKKVINKYIKRENMKIPEQLNYDRIKGLSNESREELKKIKPDTIGQASRIQGVRNSDLLLLIIESEKILFHVEQLEG